MTEDLVTGGPASWRTDGRSCQPAGAEGGPEGATVTAPDVRILSNGIELQTSLPSAPDDTWKHFSLALDAPTGWRYVDGSGSRPATLTDLHHVRDTAFGLWIRGLYADGAGETWIDNVLVDRHH